MITHRNWFLGALLSAVIVAVALAVAARWHALAEQKQARQWIGEVRRLGDEDAADLVRSLRKHDSRALPALAAALGDRRPGVVAAAQEAIGNLAADWRHFPAEESVPRLTELSSRLAGGYAELLPQQQRFVRQLAETMLRWPLDDADFPADDLVASCERILAMPAPDASAVEGNPLPSAVAPQVASRPNRPSTAQPVTELAQPAPVVELPTLIPPEPAGGETSDVQPVEPRQFIQPRVDAVPN